MVHTLHRRTNAAFPVSAGILCLGSLIWAYWTTLEEINERWAHDPQYSHGYLVPIFALFLLWYRRDHLSAGPLHPSWWGFVVLAGGILLRLLGAYFHFVWVDQISLLPCIAGIFLLLGGTQGWRWAQPAVLFLVFMIPLPYSMGPRSRTGTSSTSEKQSSTSPRHAAAYACS
jgi:hypothetical protein